MALLVDQYELTMLRVYREQAMTERAVFSLFVRRLPPGRNYLLACGLDAVLAFLERLHFPPEACAHLASQPAFDRSFAEWLGKLRFRGDVRAVPEGTPVFPGEPILEVEASLPEAQVVETFVMNQIHLQTVLASKAARVKRAAGDRAVVDFGLRRMHGTDAGLKAARAFHVAGVDATSNVLAGRVWDIPVAGTMAHSFVQAHDREIDAFRAFVACYPETILLVDTYDTLEGVENVIRLAGEMGSDFRVRGVRLDSGDLGELARRTRARLDEAGLGAVEIFASGGLDEHAIRSLVREKAPIDGFGVGTGMGVSVDAPSLDIAYKMTGYAGRGRLKLSAGKPILPGRKQVFRLDEGGRAAGDLLARADETAPGRPLLVPVMEKGRRLTAGRATPDEARARAREELAALPPAVVDLDPADPPYAVETSPGILRHREEVAREVAAAEREAAGEPR